MEKGIDFPISVKNLLKFSLPVIFGVVFENIYGLVDSLFVANLIGVDALSAVNIVSPSLSITLAIAIMIATGGCAIVSSQMGEGKMELARRNFSFFTAIAFGISLAISLIGLIFKVPLLQLLGADEALYPLCEAYAIPIFIIVPFAMIGMMLQLFYTASGRPGLGFALSVTGGILNMVLDYVLIKVANMGIAGAAWATGIGYSIQSVAGMIYFFANRKGTLYFVKPKWNGKALLKACGNGMSEMVGSLAVSITMIAMNVILMKYSGPNGVAAGAIVLAAQMILSSLYMGYLQGISPVISFHYGAKNNDNLKKIFKAALYTIAGMSVITFALSFPLAHPLASFYAEGEENVMNMAIEGIHIFSFAFLLMGFNLFGSALFTALNDGITSAILSVFRTLIFLIIPLIILPIIWETKGVWIALPTAEALSIILTFVILKRKRNIYHYV